MTGLAANAATDEVTARFLDYRELLFAVGYNMLGSIADTEDVLQEAWLAWAARHRDPAARPVDNPRAYLVRVVANHAVARRAEIGRRRETYIGPWLPEPLVTVTEDVSGLVERKESLSMAVLVVLETLTPLERAVFVLHDVFGFGHPEIAAILDRSPTAVRQLASRARKHIQARRPSLHDKHIETGTRFRADRQSPADKEIQVGERIRPGGRSGDVRTDKEIQANVGKRLAEATLRGDLATMLEVLAPDVTLWTDSGGVGPARSLTPVHGHERVAALFMAVAADLPAGHLTIGYRRVAEDPCVLVFSDDSPIAAVVVDLDAAGERIQTIYSITNPHKLSRIN
ncbi:sigma-70 family RNA polymerase sigma factor [Nocardia sp. ET3-3]|uniref:Sigma-70 family RNA polymerase sigma factor n=1 Tax=Nocardia terrae TaxID=2675851 RepID=A0A7K1UVV7_9NOCA|nr:sigma-70 family RNA polymerase sigma factor [Nocardia terrae]MVU78008.1 sigma-70 family RNA polymerase sigma factor [Nocardia terrae]